MPFSADVIDRLADVRPIVTYSRVHALQFWRLGQLRLRLQGYLFCAAHRKFGRSRWEMARSDWQRIGFEKVRDSKPDLCLMFTGQAPADTRSRAAEAGGWGGK